MGGILTEIKGSGINKTQFQSMCLEIENLYDKLEDQFSDYRENSIVSQVNRDGYNKWVSLPDETYYVISNAINIAEKSNHYFDITVLPLVLMWKKHARANTFPETQEIKDTLDKISSNYIFLNPSEKKIRFKKKGVKIDLGAIAKGYMTDLAISLMIKRGLKRALINSGGNIVVYSAAEISEPFNLGIYNPDENGVQATIEIFNGALVTSGNYNRYFEIKEKKYSHIIDPHTGYTSKGCHSVTIQAETGMMADAYSTAICSSGENPPPFKLPQEIKVHQFMKGEMN